MVRFMRGLLAYRPRGDSGRGGTYMALTARARMRFSSFPRTRVRIAERMSGRTEPHPRVRVLRCESLRGGRLLRHHGRADRRRLVAALDREAHCLVRALEAQRR